MINYVLVKLKNTHLTETTAEGLVEEAINGCPWTSDAVAVDVTKSVAVNVLLRHLIEAIEDKEIT